MKYFILFIFLFPLYCGAYESSISFEDKIEIIESKCRIAQKELEQWQNEKKSDPSRAYYEYYMRGYIDACLMNLSILKSPC